MLVVQKYGGTSVADLERIGACAERCLSVAREGHQLVVVVSAMAGETNRLIAMANELVASEGDASSGPYVAGARRGPEFDRELDQLVATGEKVSASLLAMAICERGGHAISLVGHQLGLRTDGKFTKARITAIGTERIIGEVSRGRVVVCAGFQGVNPAGDIMTLGRGGSDTSAVALAAALNADVCEILTDVDGVFTTDPRVVAGARKIDRISYDEMLELSSLGAKVLQIRSVAFASRYGVAVHVRNSRNDNEGTFIVPPEPSMESIVVSGVALDRNEAKVTLVGMPDVPGTIARVFGALGRADIVVDMIIQNASHDSRTDITFTVPQSDLKQAVELISPMEFGGEKAPIETDPDICKISIVGLGMRTHAGVASKAFEILATEGINIQMVSTSEIKVSVVVDERYGELALRALHEGFELEQEPEPA